jgi:hypothetical protein
MKLLTVSTTLLAVAALALTGCPCTKAHDTCGVSGKAGFFTVEDAQLIKDFDGKQDYWTKKKVEHPEKYTGLKLARRCCDAFNALVNPYCQDQRIKFCDAKCKDDEKVDCKNGDSVPVRNTCRQQAAPVFRKHIPLCEEMTVKGLETYWPQDGGAILCPPSDQ